MAARKMRKTVSYLLLVLGLAGCLAGCSARQTTRAEPNRNESGPPQTAPTSVRSARSAGFASRERLLEHYHKHGGEFGNISIEEYLRTAQALRDHSLGAAVVEAVRTDGVITRFDRDTGTFIAFNRDGIIRTCFRPNDGEAYFRRQLKRRD
jgi:pyocin large subunit-like protein